MRLQVKIPDLAEQDRVLRATGDVNLQIQSLTEEKSKLVNLRQGVMDDLLTGRVRATGGGMERVGAD
jgi:hypothetical protein